MKKKSKIIIVVIIIVITLIISLWSLSPPKTKSIGEVVNNPEKYIGKNINIKGTIENNSIKNSTDNLLFNITDGENKLFVIYKGSIPNNFAEEKKVILKGVLEENKEKNLQFNAEKITIGCPSKYN